MASSRPHTILCPPLITAIRSEKALAKTEDRVGIWINPNQATLISLGNIHAYWEFARI
jgi:hypothetical protein